jgi:hypothetical protein
MAALALSGGWSVLRQARREMRGEVVTDEGTLQAKVSTDQESDQRTYNTLRIQATTCIDLQSKWQLLQAAHIVGQRFIWLHLDSHLQMMKLALRTRNWIESAGQVFRIALVPFGHLLGRLPVGNPGTADVSAFSTQEISPRLRDLIAKANKG